MNRQINSTDVSDTASETLISRRLTFLMHRVMTVTNGVGQPCFRKLGVSIPEARALIGLVELGSMKVGDLAALISADFSTLSHLLRRLERDGWIARTRDETDSRSVKVALTEAGADLAEQCRVASLGHEKILAKGLSLAELKRLKDTLEVVYRNAVEGFGEEGPRGGGASAP